MQHRDPYPWPESEYRRPEGRDNGELRGVGADRDAEAKAPITVLVADDHPVVREHVAEAVGADERLELVGEAGDGKEALRRAEECHPNTVVLDLTMPVLDGAAVLRRLREERMPIRVLLLPGHASVSQMYNALRYDPDSLLLMDTSAEGICEELVAIGWGTFSHGRVNLERAQMLAHSRVELSSREWDVLKLSAEGLTRMEVSVRLHFAPSTVRDIRRDVCRKLGASSMQAAIVMAMRIGMLE